MCAQLLVDDVPNAKIVSDVLDVALPQHCGGPEGVALPQQPGEPKEAYSQEILDAHISSEEDTPARNGTKCPDLVDVSVLYAHVVQGSVPAEQPCRTYVVLRIKELLGKETYSLKCSNRTATLCSTWIWQTCFISFREQNIPETGHCP